MAADRPFTCATCDAIIAHHPVFFLGLTFCCAGCAADGPCMCSYDSPDGGQPASVDRRRKADRPARARLVETDPVDVAPPVVEPPLPSVLPSASSWASVEPSPTPLAPRSRPVVERRRTMVSATRIGQP